MSTCKGNGDVVAYTGPKVHSPPRLKSDIARIADALERIAGAAKEANPAPTEGTSDA